MIWHRLFAVLGLRFDIVLNKGSILTGYNHRIVVVYLMPRKTPAFEAGDIRG